MRAENFSVRRAASRERHRIKRAKKHRGLRQPGTITQARSIHKDSDAPARVRWYKKPMRVKVRERALDALTGFLGKFSVRRSAKGV